MRSVVRIVFLFNSIYISTIKCSSSIRVMNDINHNNFNPISTSNHHGSIINELVSNRILAVGDFDSFNEQINDYVLQLPDSEAGQSSTLDIKITNLLCTHLVIGDIVSSWKIYNATTTIATADPNSNATTTIDSGGAGVSAGYDETLSLNFDVTPFGVDCTGNYEYAALLFLSGSGSFRAVSTNSAAQLRFDLNSVPGFDEEFPTNLDVQTCTTTITIDNINFDGTGFGSNLLNIAQGLIANVVEGQAENIICTKIQTLVPDKLNPLLVNASAKIENITGPNDGTDPLFVETNYTNPNNRTLLNFQQSSNSTTAIDDNTTTPFFDAGNLLLLGIEQAKTLLEGTTANGTLKINTIFQNIVNDNGIFELNFTSANGLLRNFLNPLILNITDPIGTQVLLQDIRVTGLNTIQKFTLLDPIGRYTLQNEFNWDVLKVEVDVKVTIIPATSPDDNSLLYSPSGRQIVEDATIILNFQKLNIVAGLFLAIDVDKLKELQIGSLLDTKYLLPCLLEIIDDFQISSFNLSYDRSGASPLSITGVSNVGVERTAQTMVDAFLAAFEPSVTQMVPKFIKQFATETMTGTGRVCPNFATSTSQTATIDFRDLLLPPQQSKQYGGSGIGPYGNVVHQLYTILRTEFFMTDPTTKLATEMNTLMTQLLKSNKFKWKGNVIATNRQIQAGGLNVNLQLRAYDAYIRNIDTMGAPLALLEPTNNPNILNNSATIGINRNLVLGISLILGLADDETNIHNDFDIQIAFKDLEFIVTVLLKISENALFAFPLRDLNNFNCWLATIPAPKLDKYGVRLSNAKQTLGMVDFITYVKKSILNLNCKNCTGPKLMELTDLLSKNEDAVTATTRTLLDFASGLIKGEFLAATIDRALHDAPRFCPHSPEYKPNNSKTVYQSMETTPPETSTSFLVGILIICASLILLFAIIYLAVKLLIRRRHRRWLATRSPQQLNALYFKQQEKKKKHAEVNESTTSMFRSLAIPLWVRYGMPLIIMVNIGFFLGGHLSLGASVTILVSLGGETLRSDDFFSFSLAKSTVKIWEAGGKALAVLIFLASFAWPYSKSIISFVLWFTPTRNVSVSTRGSILLWLDALAKWSMVDIFVLVGTIACFRISITSPDAPYLPDDLYQIDLLVAPKWGLYANLIAQLICQISSHYIIYYHRRIVSDYRNHHLQTQPTTPDSFEDEDEEFLSSVSLSQPRANSTENLHYDKLCDHAFCRVHRAESDKLVPRRFVSPSLVTLALSASVVIALGCILPTFSVNILGIVGVLVEFGQGFVSAEINYSVFRVIETLFAQAKLSGTVSDYLGLGTLSVLAVLTVLIVPLLQLMALLSQWLISLNPRQRKKLSLTIEILQAWQYIEVYLIAMIVGSWQLGPISEYMINPYCKSLSGLFGQLVFYGILKEEDAQCLKTDFVIKPTFVFLFVAAIVLHLLNTFIMNAMVQYIRDMEDNSRKGDINNGKLDTLDDLTLLEGTKVNSAIMAAIDPIDPLFTDKFRWFLVGDTIRGRLPSVPCNNNYLMDRKADVNHGILANNVEDNERSPTRSINHSNRNDSRDDDIQSIGLSTIGYLSDDLKP